MNPPPSVLDGAFGLHQVFERVVRKGDRDSKVAQPSVQEDKQQSQSGAALEDVRDRGA